MRMDGLLLVAQAVAEAMDGRPVEAWKLRARLTHDTDQLRTLGAHLRRVDAEAAEACGKVAGLEDRLMAAVDSLDRGDVQGARAALRDALINFGKG